ncbi:PaaX family transcriptional regulator C-terminal domain-containing protein [Solimonas sp. SE-A11]|uniref:PaaX family transcriptional regulator C-terminal domain-containing protein n=1 Tax=Solimonas sp. SE-A11 TaxID=3054954 RepID=UPI00259D2F41|nr:PaaX family transcriptional regulator C-terminal domain-containing protein [Solimonas sp. SE-A11]MDM4768922.1 PaaX family transcriptional regulator C-terminal domain-containing protein [Solimonas sp. SE-A11]
MIPKPRRLILGLLLAAEGQPLSVRDAIAGCGLFGISANSVRVALVRLSADGLIEATERGSYRLGASAHELADDVATWRHAEQRLRPWQGGWLAVHCAGLGRSDRVALRRRTRALAMLGFRELDGGLHLRPDNIEDSVDAVRKRLHALGLEKQAPVFVAGEFDTAREAAIRKLWDGKALNASYRKLRVQLEEWLARADRLEPEAAARESYLLGSNAIRHVVYDPLLPAPLVDADARHAFVETVRRFDRAGQDIWRKLGSLSGKP